MIAKEVLRHSSSVRWNWPYTYLSDLTTIMCVCARVKEREVGAVRGVLFCVCMCEGEGERGGGSDGLASERYCFEEGKVRHYLYLFEKYFEVKLADKKQTKTE